MPYSISIRVRLRVRNRTFDGRTQYETGLLLELVCHVTQYETSQIETKSQWGF